MKAYISSDPDVLNGTPVIKGTRVPVERILFLIKDGFTLTGIQQQYPHIGIKTLEGFIEELSQKVGSKKLASVS